MLYVQGGGGGGGSERMIDPLSLVMAAPLLIL